MTLSQKPADFSKYMDWAEIPFIGSSKILTEVKVKFQFIDHSIVLENWAEIIQLDENGQFKQIRFSPRLDYVPLMEKGKLDLFYLAR